LDWSDLPGVVIGGVIAAGAGWVQSLAARRDRREGFDDEVKARRADDAWNRAYERAQEIVTALDDIQRLVHEQGRVSLAFMPEVQDERTAVEAALERMRAASVYLPNPARQRIENVVALLPRLDGLFGSGYIDTWPRSAGRVVIASARDTIGRHLRQEDLGEMSPDVTVFLRGMEDYDSDMDEQIERQIAEQEAQKAGDDA
jgi:hypothetical protein